MKSVLLIVSALCIANGQLLPESPCPTVFSYQYDYTAQRWAGQIQVFSPTSGSIRIDGNFTLAGTLANVSLKEIHPKKFI
jgi:hypothetical protein